MKFKIQCKHKGADDSKAWWENYNKKVENPQKWAEETVDEFNATLRPHEKPRELIGVQVLEDDNNGFHNWYKLTAGQSVPFKGSIVDLYKCDKCGMSGKRFGISSHIKNDSKFKGKAFDRCDTAKVKIAENPDKYKTQ